MIEEIKNNKPQVVGSVRPDLTINGLLPNEEKVEQVVQILAAKAQPLLIREATIEDSLLIKKIMDESWGGEPLVVRAEKYFPSSLPGFLAFQGEKLVGFIFYTINTVEIEIIVLEAFTKFNGLGTQLVDMLKDIGRAKGVKRIFLMTTNDNVDALRFYQKRGFHICGIHLDSVKESRKLKPSIGFVGDFGIPVRDEIDLEHLL